MWVEVRRSFVQIGYITECHSTGQRSVATIQAYSAKRKVLYPIICEINGQTTARYIHARLGATSQINATHVSPLPARTSRLQNDFAQGATVTGAGHAPCGLRDQCKSAFCGTEHGNCVYHRAITREGQAGACGEDWARQDLQRAKRRSVLLCV